MAKISKEATVSSVRSPTTKDGKIQLESPKSNNEKHSEESNEELYVVYKTSHVGEGQNAGTDDCGSPSNGDDIVKNDSGSESHESLYGNGDTASEQAPKPHTQSNHEEDMDSNHKSKLTDGAPVGIDEGDINPDDRQSVDDLSGIVADLGQIEGLNVDNGTQQLQLVFDNDAQFHE